MEIIPVHTRAMLPPQDDLYAVFDEYVPKLHERDVIVVTSKIVAIHQGRTISVNDVGNREALLKDEAEMWLSHPHDTQKVGMAIVRGAVIPFAGVDESNANGHYVLLPSEPHIEAARIRAYFKKRDDVRELGVIIADSTVVPLRAGNTSVALGFSGIVPVRDYRGEKDLFGRVQGLTQSNRVDPLAALAGFVGGEGNESTPIVVLRNVPGVDFTDEDMSDMVRYPADDDFYREALKIFHRDP